MMMGQSKSLYALRALLRRFAACDATVLLEGETGTGKELAAREIHYASARRDRAFVPVNCGALPDSLIESELFGHCRGAFTDAKRAQSGLIDHARHGTLFLDEVESLTPKAQVTLLRFLQDNQYRPVGSGEERRGDVRIVAATNVPLLQLVAEGCFRRDLLYRLNSLHVRLPPLRERKGDVAVLAEHFLRDATLRMDIAARRLTPEALDVLEAYTWPGNVRELENVVLRVCLCADGPDIGLRELTAAEPVLVVAARSSTPLEEAHVPGNASTLSERAAVEGPSSFNAAKVRAIASFERSYLIDLLRRAGGNVSIAARLCNIERRQLGKLLKKHSIEKSQFRTSS